MTLFPIHLAHSVLEVGRRETEQSACSSIIMPCCLTFCLFFLSGSLLLLMEKTWFFSGSLVAHIRPEFFQNSYKTIDSFDRIHGFETKALRLWCNRLEAHVYRFLLYFHPFFFLNSSSIRVHFSLRPHSTAKGKSNEERIFRHKRGFWWTTHLFKSFSPLSLGLSWLRSVAFGPHTDLWHGSRVLSLLQT